MPTKRKRTTRPQEPQISDAVIAAFKAGDYLALHRALHLRPWETSPLPSKREALGVNYGPPPKWANAEDWKRAQQLRRTIEDAIHAD